MNLLRRFLGIVFGIPRGIIWIIAYPLAIFVIVIIKIWDHFTRKHFAPIPRPPIHRTVSAPQVPSGPVKPPHGYQARLLPDASTEIIHPLGLRNLGLLKQSWVAGLGWIARRTYVLGRFWDRVHSDLAGFEIHHGIWDTRKGCTDTLWLRKIRLFNSPWMILVAEHEDPWVIGDRAKGLHELTVDPDIAALGRFLSNKTGAPLSEITEEIPQPDHGA